MEFKSTDNKHILPVKVDFWTAYLKLSLKSGVSEKNAKWYVYRAKQFARHMKMPLKKCDAQDVKGFLVHLESSGTESWKIEVARNALRLMFRDFLKVLWAVNDKSNSPSPTPPPAGGEMSAGAIHELPLQSPQKTGISSEQIFEKLQTEIRYLHYDIRTVQELLGHADVSTTMIYTHVLNSPGIAVRSPVD